MIAIDTETCRIRPGELAPPFVCMSWADHSREDLAKDAGPLEGAVRIGAQIVGANIAYDMAVVGKDRPDLLEAIFDAYRAGRVYDVQIRQRLIDIAEGVHEMGGRKYSLAALAKRHLGIEMDKDTWRLRYGELRDTPLEDWPEGARAYPKKDARITWDVAMAQREYAGAKGIPLEDEVRQCRAAFALHLMSCWGLRTDPEQCAKLRNEIEEQIEGARKTCEEAGLVRKNGVRDTKAAKKRMINAGGQLKMTKKHVDMGGNWREDAQDIGPDAEKYVALDEESCKLSGDPVLEAYGLYGRAGALLNKLEMLEHGAHLPLQTRFSVLKDTGRTASSSPGTIMVGDNFQNFSSAPGIRECIVPRPGYYLCSVDYDGAELHTLAQVCLWALGRSRLAEALNSGTDPHLLLACEQLLEISYERGLELKAAGDAEIDKARKTSKGPNFGYPGGMGPAGFVKFMRSMGQPMTEERARYLRDAWLATWPEMNDYFAWIRRQLGPDNLATVKQFLSERVRGYIPYTVTANTFFQGLAADAAKSSLLPIARECYVDRASPLYGTRPILFVHDEVIAEVPIDRAHDAAHRLAEVMVDKFNEWVPDVPVSASPALMERWYKKAEAVYEGGVLVPWAP